MSQYLYHTQGGEYIPTTVSLKEQPPDPNHLLKQMIWVYFLLLIFEGALRKWFLPGLATPLLVVRDPLAFYLIVKAWQRGLLPSTPYLTGMVIIGILGMLTAIMLGHGSLVVAVYGARALVLYFPLLFVIGRIFNRDDVLKMGKVALWLTIPMTLLIALQFYSPQSAWVNRGVGGDIEGAGFGGALGYFRPPGTFSFTNGTTLFYGFVSCFIFYFWFHPQNINRLALIGATACLVVAIPLSISRGLFFQVGVSVIFAGFAISRNPNYVGHVILAGIGVLVSLAVLSQTSFFSTATGAFSARFESANEQEGGLKGVLIDRFLGGMVGALTESSDLPVFGYGLGMSTNVGIMLLTGAQETVISDEEWGRLIGELGPLLGLALIFIRVGISLKIAYACYQKLIIGDLLPWMLLSFGFLTLLQSQWAQPTSLGFCMLIGGLMIASLHEPQPSKLV